MNYKKQREKQEWEFDKWGRKAKPVKKKDSIQIDLVGLAEEIENKKEQK